LQFPVISNKLGFVLCLNRSVVFQNQKASDTSVKLPILKIFFVFYG
jgi:hypothetical protein